MHSGTAALRTHSSNDQQRGIGGHKFLIIKTGSGKHFVSSLQIDDAHESIGRKFTVPTTTTLRAQRQTTDRRRHRGQHINRGNHRSRTGFDCSPSPSSSSTPSHHPYFQAADILFWQFDHEPRTRRPTDNQPLTRRRFAMCGRAEHRNVRSMWRQIGSQNDS